MKLKILLPLFAILFSSAFIKAQDIIILKNGQEIKAKLAEEGTDKIKFKKFSRPKGRFHTYPIKNLFILKYENGTKKVFIPPSINSQDLNATSKYEYDQYRTLYHRYLIKGTALTSTGGSLVVAGIALMTVGWIDVNKTGDAAQFQIIFGQIGIASGIPLIITGPIQLVKANRCKRRAEEAKASISFNPVFAPDINSGRAMNFKTGAGIRINF